MNVLKNQRSLFFLTLLAALLILSSCQKENPFGAPNLQANVTSPPNYAVYDVFGPKLELAVSRAATEQIFAVELLEMTSARPTGDFEVLLKDFVQVNMMTEQNIGAYIVSRSEGAFTQVEFDNFLTMYPSTVIAVRGNAGSWIHETHVPPVKFVSSTFDKTSTSAPASQAGSPVTINLDGVFSDAVIAIHISERHDFDGHIIGHLPGGGGSSSNTPPPAVTAIDINDTFLPGIVCDPEPTECPLVPPMVQTFTATPENGGVKLTYSVSNFPESLCRWGWIRITRRGGGNPPVTWYRHANQVPIFYDYTGVPHTQYDYEISAYIRYVNPANPVQEFLFCQMSGNTLTASALYPPELPILKTLIGQNVSNSIIQYDWYNDLGVAITDYRLRRVKGASITSVVTVPHTTTSYAYHYPEEDRGKLIKVIIQYTTGGPWKGTFYDKTYGSYRNSGQPLKYYGLYMPDVEAFEYGEGALFGAPEVRLIAVQAGAGGTAETIAETFLPMKACTEVLQEKKDIKLGFLKIGTRTIDHHINTGYYYPERAPNGYEILNSWDNHLHSSAITVKTLETDDHEPRYTASNTTTTEATMTASYGEKVNEGNGTVGITTKYSDSETVTVYYPYADIPIGHNVIYYHEDPTTVKGTQLFGDINFSDKCKLLNDNL